jgi:hypothetical protein
MTIYTYIALIRIEDLQVATYIEPPPISAIRSPRVKKRKIERYCSNSIGLNSNHYSGCGSPYYNKANKYYIRNREITLGGRPNGFNI